MAITIMYYPTFHFLYLFVSGYRDLFGLPVPVGTEYPTQDHEPSVVTHEDAWKGIQSTRRQVLYAT